MKKVLKYVLAVAVTASALISCKKDKVISRGDMAEIYAEMFVADQLILQNSSLRRMADTSQVYEPIFQKYGYTSDDYRASVSHYIKDPDRYARILRNTGVILEKKLKELKKEKAIIDSMNRLQDEINDFVPERIFALTGLDNTGLCAEDSLVFYVDSAGGDLFFDTRQWLDTAFYGPEMVIKDTVSTVADTTVATEPVKAEAPTDVRKPAVAPEKLVRGNSRRIGLETDIRKSDNTIRKEMK